MPTKKDVSRLIDDKLFQIADAHAEEALYRVAMGNACVVEEETDVLGRMIKASRYYRADEYEQTTGGMINACTEAGIAFGLAFGLRLRGVR